MIGYSPNTADTEWDLLFLSRKWNPFLKQDTIRD